jgi:gamma-glutamylcyclotransferase (GGCT)/AIG2-like uncharacterized protein YtfP
VKPAPLPVFVYGTLRPGEPLSWLTKAAAAPTGMPRRAYLRGYQLYWNHSHSYPYMAKTANPNDVVRGSWFQAELGEPFKKIVDIELGAGYESETVHPTMYRNNGELGASLAFVLPPHTLEFWKPEPMQRVTDHVWGGLVYDWVVEKEAWEMLQLPSANAEVQYFPRLTMDSDT